MTRAFRCNHEYVIGFRRLDETEVDIETVGKRQRGAFLQVWLNVFFIYGSLLLVGRQDHDHVGILHCVSDVGYLESGFFGFLPGIGAFTQTDRDINTAVFQVVRMCMPL